MNNKQEIERMIAILVNELFTELYGEEHNDNR